tara:strand:+ start:90 stop:539 length:450 start_codon:yes stop_codon:yes gene_type:complete
MTNKIFAGPAGSIPVLVEGIVADAFTAGQLLERTVDTGITKLATTAKASTTFGNETLIAKEVPSTLGGHIDTPWEVNNTGESIAPATGDFIWLSIAAGQNFIKKGMAIASNGDGDFKIGATDGTEQIFAFNRDIINVTAAQTLVLCRVA